MPLAFVTSGVGETLPFPEMIVNVTGTPPRPTPKRSFTPSRIESGKTLPPGVTRPSPVSSSSVAGRGGARLKVSEVAVRFGESRVATSR